MLSNKQMMASRLWFLAQATSRLAVNSLSRHNAKPSLRYSYNVRRFLFADQKPYNIKSAKFSSDVDAEASDVSNNPPELPKTPKTNGKKIKHVVFFLMRTIRIFVAHC